MLYDNFGLNKIVLFYFVYFYRSLALLGMEVLRRNGEVVGYFRRADHAFALNKGIGYGYVQKSDGSTVTNAYLKEGEYTVERMGEIYPAQIHLKTPFDPSNNRIKGFYE